MNINSVNTTFLQKIKKHGQILFSGMIVSTMWPDGLYKQIKCHNRKEHHRNLIFNLQERRKTPILIVHASMNSIGSQSISRVSQQATDLNKLEVNLKHPHTRNVRHSMQEYNCSSLSLFWAFNIGTARC